MDLVYPPTCVNCGVVGFEICPDCFQEIEILDEKVICPTCSLPLAGNDQCSFCINNPVFFTKLISWGVYRGVLRKTILRMKYRRGLGLVEYILHPLLECIVHADLQFDMIVPVPLGTKRRRMRGYNQTILFARPISTALEKPLVINAIQRVRETKSQVGLNLDERRTNLRGAFKAQKDCVLGKSILLVDDVATTCSTLNECAKELLVAGASNIFCFTLARAISLQ